MATIFYAINGEGRGHASRARAIIEGLRSRHRVVVYAAGHAFQLLSPVYANSEIEVRAIPGMRFHYTANRRVALGLSAIENLPYLSRIGRAVERITAHMEIEQPKLAITDFEPIIPRAALCAGIPLISLDHQHFLVTNDLSTLPLFLQTYAKVASPFVRAFCHSQTETIVSSFFVAPPKHGWEHAAHVGVMLRPEVVSATISDGRYLVAYLRRSVPQSVIRALQNCGLPVHIYGLGAREPVGRLRFFPVDALRFIEDLATSRALISTAGNQLIGEALYLQKPVLAFPENGNFEQYINAHFLERSQAGATAAISRVRTKEIRMFLTRLDTYRSHIDRIAVHGNSAALAIINSYLPQSTPDKIRSQWKINPYEEPSALSIASFREKEKYDNRRGF